MSFDNRFETAFNDGLSDVKFFVRRGKKVTVEILKKDAIAFQEAIEKKDVKEVDGVD